ncbi:MAG: hypothetical protein ACYDCK_03500 [Thermoplasmatota archaeon]
MSTGFVVSDKVRRAIFIEIMAGERDLARIVKKHRLVRPAAERALKELQTESLVAATSGELALTDAGQATAAEMKRNDMLR